MATEIDISESVLLKKGEIEVNPLSSESFEEKVIELLGDKVKQLETSNLVAGTVNTQLDTGLSTNESGTFFQALSDPMVISGEQSNILASGEYKTTTEDQEERKSTIIKASTEEKSNDDVEAVSTHSKRKEENEDKNNEKTTEIDDEDQEKELTLEKDQASAGEDIIETITGQDATIVADSKEQDLHERQKEFLNEETMDKSTDAVEASEWCEKEANDEKEQAPEESIKKIVLDIEQEEEREVKDEGIEVKTEQNELLHVIATDAHISTQIKSQVETMNNEVKNEEEASIPSIKELCEENSSEKAEYEISSVNLDEKTIAILNKDQEEEKEQEANVLEKDQVEDDVTCAQDVMVEGELEEKNHHNEVIEPEVVKAKDSIEKNTEEIIYSGVTAKKIEPQSLVNVIPTDVSITTQTKPEEETINNDEEAMKNDDVHTKESGSSMVEETCDETVSDKPETEETLDLSDSSNTVSHENEIPNKDEDQVLSVSEKGQAESQVETVKLEGYEEQVIENNDSKKESYKNLSIKEACEEKEQNQEEDKVTHSQDQTSSEELQEDNNVTIENEEKANEKDTSEEIGPENVEPEVGLNFSYSMEASNNEVLSMLEKDHGDSDGIKISQDTEGEVVEETLVAGVKELNETPREFVKEETEEKSIDAQEESEKCETEIENNPEQNSGENVEKIEQEEETEEISAHVEIDEKMEQNEVSDGATSDASLSTPLKPQVETAEHEEKDDEEAAHVNDGQNEEVDNRTITEVHEENSSEKVEFESSVVKLNEKTTESKNEGEDEEKEEEVNVLPKDQDDEDVTSAQEVKVEGGLKEKNHDSEGNEHEVVEANEYIEADTEEITCSLETPENIEKQSLINIIPKDVIITTQTNLEEETTKNEEAIKSDDGQTKESGNHEVKEVCEESVSDKAKFETTNNNEDQEKEEEQEKEKDQENDEVMYSQDATRIDDLQAKSNESIINEENNDVEAIQEEACEKTIPESGESEVGLNLSDNMEPSKQEALNTEEKDQGDTRSLDATTVDIKETTSGQNATIVADFTDLNENPREFVKEKTEVKSNAQEASEEFKKGEHEIIEDKPEESVTSIEQEEETEEIRPHVTIDENMEKNLLLHDITSDASVSKQTKSSQVETTNINEEDEEDAMQSEDGQKEKSDNASINEVCEVNSSEKIEEESSTMELDENAIAVLNKDEDEEKEQEVNVVEKREDVVIIAQDVSIEECIEETNHHDEGTKPEVAKAEVTIEKDDEEITHTIETIEQQSLISTSPIDGISTQTELEKENKECEENKDQEILESDSSQTKESESPVDEEICDKTVSEKAIKDEDQENEQELDTSEKTQSGVDDITSSQNAATEDIRETTVGQHVTPDAYIEEGTEDNSIDAPEASGHEDGANNESEQNPEESVNGIVLETEQKDYIEEIKPSVETNEQKDGCISTQTESQEEVTQNEEIYLKTTGPEEVIDISTSSNVNQNEKEISVISKHEVQEKEQELNVSEIDQGSDEITHSHDATVVYVEDLQGISMDEGNEHELVETIESTKDDYEVIEASVQTEEKVEHQTESPEETTEKGVREATSAEKIDFEEGLKLSDSSEIIINEKTITSSDEGEEVEEKNDDVISSDNASKEEIQETTTGQSLTTLAYFDEGRDPSEITKEILEEEAKDKSINTQEATEQCENGANNEAEQNPEVIVNTPANSSSDVVEDCIKEDETDLRNNAEKLEAVQQAERTEDISETKDEFVLTEQASSEFGQPKEQNDEEIQDCPTETVYEKTEDDITEKVDASPHQSIEDTNEDTTEDVKCFSDETTREIEISTLEHKPNEEKNSGLDEVSNDTAEVEPQEDISSLKTSIEDTSSSEKIKVESEDLPIEDDESVSEQQIPEVVPESKDLQLTEEFLTSAATTNVDEEKETVTNDTSSDEMKKTEETTGIKQESVEEGREETNLEKVEAEEGVEDYCIGTKENSQHQVLLDVITTEVCNPTQTEPKEESFENTEMNDDEAEASSDKVGSEEGVTCSDSLNTPLDENEIVGKEENLEKEQELVMSEVQCGGDDAIISENISNEDKKETTDKYAATTANLDEDQSPMSEEILEEVKDKSIVSKEIPSELVQPEEQIVEDIQEKTEDNIIKDVVLDERTRDVEPQEKIAPTSSPEILTKHISNPEDVKAECENLPVADFESASEVQIPEAVPKSEESSLKEECVISETATHVDEELVTVTKEISSDQNHEPSGEHRLTYESMADAHIEETTGQPEESHITHEKNDSLSEERDIKEEVTQEHQLNSAEDCSEMVKDIILTKKVPLAIQKEFETKDSEQLVEEDISSTEETQKEIAHEISYSDPITDDKTEVTEVTVDSQLIVKEDLQATEDISGESKLENDNAVEAPKEEIIPSLDDAPTLEPQVDLSKTESTANPSENEKLLTQELASIREVTVESEDSKVKEECIILETAAYTDENKVEEEQKIITNDISSAPDTEEGNVKQTPKSNEGMSSDLITEEKALAEENIELHGEFKPASESMIEEIQVNETKPPPEQSDITSESIMDDQNSESKLEHMSTKDLEDEKKDMENDFILSPEDQIKSTDSQNETKENVILTEDVDVETEVDKTSSDQKELVKEREFSEPLLTDVTERIHAAEDLSSTTGPTKLDINEDTEQTFTTIGEVKDDSFNEASMNEILPVREDAEASELQVNLPQTESTDTPISNLTDREVLEEGAAEETKDTSALEFEKKEKDDDLKSETFFKTEMKEEHPVATNNTCETVTDGDPRGMVLEGTEEIDAKEDVEVIAEGEVKAIEQSYQDEVTKVTVHDQLSHSDEKIASMVPPEELRSVSAEDQTNELAQERDTAKFEHNSGSQEPEEDKKMEDSICLVKEQVELMHSGSQEQAEDKKMEDSLILQSEEKEQLEESPAKDAQKHEKDVEPQLLGTKEATLEFVNLENQREQKKEADENIEAAISIKNVKSSDVEITQHVMDVPVPISASTRKLEDLEVPSVMDATDDKKDLESTCKRSITTEEVSGTKQEPLELDSPVVTAATRDLKISQKDVIDDLSTGQNQLAASILDKLPHDNESKLLIQKIDASCEKEESTAKLLIPQQEESEATKAAGSETQCRSEVSKEETNMKDECELAALSKEEIGDTGVKTDGENEQEEDNENSGSYSEAPVMVEASKDMDVKVQKKSHNILSGVGSKVKHSIAKVKKAITGGKSSPTKSSATKETI